MKTLAKYHVCNHCAIGEKTFKNILIGPGKLPGLSRNGPLETIRPVEVSLADAQHRMRMLNHSCRRNLYFVHGKNLFLTELKKAQKRGHCLWPKCEFGACFVTSCLFVWKLI